MNILNTVLTHGLSFNLNLLECKYEQELEEKIQELVLISTYWNVNEESLRQKMILYGFNLNLLECKSWNSLQSRSKTNVLISTYWNVNSDAYGQTERLDKVLISTYWNVNYRVQFLFV